MTATNMQQSSSILSEIAASTTLKISGKVRRCMVARHLPVLAHAYIRAYERPRLGLTGWVSGAILRRLFRLARKYSLLAKTGVFEYHGGSGMRLIRYNASNTQFHSIFSPKYASGYEPETSLLIDACLRSDQVFWDVGSNWGHFSLYACSRPGFCGEVHAFEPVKETFTDLTSTLIQAGLESQVFSHNFALGAVDGVSPAGYEDGVHSGTVRVGQGARGLAVDVRKGDSLGITAPNLIKLDVEGFELEVLRGLAQTIRHFSPMIIMESWLDSPQKTIEPLQLVESYGYQLFHPVWCTTDGGRAYYHARSSPGSQDRHAHLVLLPFESSERLIRSPYMNLFACHHANLRRLRETLQAVSSSS